MNKKLLAVLLAALLPSLSFGQGPQNYQCTYGSLQRRVEILSEAGLSVPCEVHYFKDTEAPGERQVLWHALSEMGFCERKTQEFIAKLQAAGWNCAQDDDAGLKAEPGPAIDSDEDAESGPDDDTDALIPGEETESSDDQ